MLPLKGHQTYKTFVNWPLNTDLCLSSANWVTVDNHINNKSSEYRTYYERYRLQNGIHNMYKWCNLVILFINLVLIVYCHTFWCYVNQLKVIEPHFIFDNNIDSMIIIINRWQPQKLFLWYQNSMFLLITLNSTFAFLCIRIIYENINFKTDLQCFTINSGIYTI